MADIATNTLQIGGNNLILQDAAVRSSLANAYSASSTYAVGDMVLKDGQLYECNTAISTAEAWTAAHWTAVTVGGELSDLKDGLTAVETQLEQTTADALNAYVTDTASGAIASFPDGADNIPVKSLTVDIEPVQSGSGDPSPDNVRPISGHTSAVVTRTGKNLFDKTTITDGYALISTTGEIEENTNCFVTDYISVKEGVTYYIPNRGTSRACVYNTDKTYAQRVSTDSGAIAWTAPIDGYIRLTSNKTVTTADDFQISIGSSAVAYEPYSGNTYTIDLDGTRYGGTLDVGTGVLTVDMVKFIADGTNIKTTGGYGAYGALWLPAIILSDTGINATTVDNIKASYLKTTPSIQTVENTISIGGGGRLIILHIGTMQGTNGAHGYNSADEVHAAVNAYLQSNNLEICYRLAEPFEVQLTAEEVTTLKGQNNIWADCGDVEVEYRADTKLYIQKVLNT